METLFKYLYIDYGFLKFATDEFVVGYAMLILLILSLGFIFIMEGVRIGEQWDSNHEGFLKSFNFNILYIIVLLSLTYLPYIVEKNSSSYGHYLIIKNMKNDEKYLLSILCGAIKEDLYIPDMVSKYILELYIDNPKVMYLFYNCKKEKYKYSIEYISKKPNVLIYFIVKNFKADECIKWLNKSIEKSILLSDINENILNNKVKTKIENYNIDKLLKNKPNKITDKDVIIYNLNGNLNISKKE